MIITPNKTIQSTLNKTIQSIIIKNMTMMFTMRSRITLKMISTTTVGNKEANNDSITIKNSRL